MIDRGILNEIRDRLQFMVDVGLDYLNLARSADSLSGGEAQRIRLATQIGSKLMGVLYILDEPSIGLHQRDNRKLINTLVALRDIGNTVVVIEHDEETMRSADFIVDIGPGAGEHGGKIVATGNFDDILKSPESITGAFLRGERSIPLPARRRKGNGQMIVVRGATENNLKNIDVYFPLGKLICISGVSGSGKSTLVSEILYRRLAQHFYRAKDRPGAAREVSGLGFIDKVINVDQSPIGRTPRSNPGTQMWGGEAQRANLTEQLSRRETGKTFYILDEPTTGLHFADIERLLNVLHRLVDAGNTVVVIEHNLDVLKTADHIIDLGPEGGDRGGRVLAAGTPEEIVRNPRSYTGQYLKQVLDRELLTA